MKLWCFMVLIFPFAAFCAETVLEVRPYTSISEARDLYLSDVIKMQNVPEVIEHHIRTIRLGNGPKLGERRVFSNRALSSLLRREVNDLKQVENVNFKIPNQIVVENRGFEINQKKIEEQLKKAWATMCENCRFEIKQLSVPRAEGPLKGKPWSLNISGQLPKGQFSYPLTIQSEQKRDQSLWVQGLMHVYREVPVTTRSLRFGERIQKADLKIEWRDVTFSYDSTPDLDSAVGRKLQRNFNVGDIVWTNSLQKEKAVRRGQVVKVVIEEDGWELTMSAVAQEAGQLGDTITVRNPKSDKLLSGTLTGIGQVSIQ